MTMMAFDEHVVRWERARDKLGSELERRLAAIREMKARGEESRSRDEERDWMRLLDTRYYLEVSDDEVIERILADREMVPARA